MFSPNKCGKTKRVLTDEMLTADVDRTPSGPQAKGHRGSDLKTSQT